MLLEPGLLFFYFLLQLNVFILQFRDTPVPPQRNSRIYKSVGCIPLLVTMSRKSSVSHPQPWLDDTKKTTPEDLSRILTAPSDGMVMCPSHGMDQVWPNLYVGEQ